MTNKALIVGLAERALRSVLVLVLAGLLGAVLVRLAPGSDVDDAQLDFRLSRRSVELIASQRARHRDPVSFYVDYLVRLGRGDVGRSELYGQAVAQLILERFGATARMVVQGLIAAWCAALVLGAAVALNNRAVTLLGATMLTAGTLSIPSAVLAVFCLVARFPPWTAVAAVVFPRVFPHVYEQVRSALARPHVLFGRARGLSSARVFLWYVAPIATVPLIALCGVSVPLAFSAAIPIEALSDSPGLGHLAWKAALGRDLPVLVTITLLLTAITAIANLCSDLVLLRLGDKTG